MQMTLAFWEAVRWRPGIGDPSLGGWVTVAAYLVVGLMAWRRGWVERKRGGNGGGIIRGRGWGRASVFWLIAGAALVLLAVNKQLDLQSLVTDVGRVWAHEAGWFEERRRVQRLFVIGVAGVGLLVGLVGVWWVWPVRRRCGLGLLGMVWLGTFVVVRAASFHHFDGLLGERVAGLKWNWIAELGGIVLVAAGAWWAGRDERSVGGKP
ncbi:MAG: hypothetical protein AAGH99_04845 [Planctomycetota bacterium]